MSLGFEKYEDTDIIYFRNKDTELFQDVKDEVEKQGLNIERVSKSDLTQINEKKRIGKKPIEEFEDTVFLNREKNKKNTHINSIEDSKDLELINNTETTKICDNKDQTKNKIEEKINSWNLQGVRVPETYESKEEVIQAHENGIPIIEKPNEGGSLGNGVQMFNGNDFSEENLYEEYIPHLGTNSEDRRMYLVGGKPVGCATRACQNEEEINGFEPLNLNNDNLETQYEEPDDISPEEFYGSLVADEAVETANNDGIKAVDYVRHPDGSIDILEVNSWPGYKINEVSEEFDIGEEVANYLVSKSKDDGRNSIMSEYVSDKLEQYMENQRHRLYSTEPSVQASTNPYTVA